MTAVDEKAVTLARDTMGLLGDVAAMTEAAAGWADDELAGGKPAKWLLMQLITANRLIAAAARGQDASHEVAAWRTAGAP